VPMADSDSDSRVGPGRPLLHIPFQKRYSGNPGGRSAKSLPTLPADALNETVVVTIDGQGGAPHAINALPKHLAGARRHKR
jgi:hypothetical protein